MNIDELRQTLQSHNQSDVIRFWDDASEAERQSLATQIEAIDFDQLDELIAGQDDQHDFDAMAAAAQSPPSILADGSGADWSVSQAIAMGEEALSAGKIGAIIVAGGQGTRLGFDKPKGMYPIGPVSERTLFEIFADRLIAVGQRYGVEIPLYVMVSEATEAATKAYFSDNGNLGLSKDQVIIFKQGTMPAVDADTGKLLLSDKASLALSPDGHGGTVRALERGGCFDDAARRGVEHLCYIQVDNPLANLCDPALIGHHLLAKSEMTSQVVRKRYPKERVGNLVLVDGHVHIIEYSDLPDDAAEETDDNGQLKIWAGSIAVHVLTVEFLRRMNQSVDALPFHRASKKVAHLDQTGSKVEPQSPNAIKFERFIFDLLPKAANAFVVESLPSEAFAPVKNAEGAETDTASLAKTAISDLHQSWLEAAGVKVADGVAVEIHPGWAASAAELAEKVQAGDLAVGETITADRYFGPQG